MKVKKLNTIKNPNLNPTKIFNDTVKMNSDNDLKHELFIMSIEISGCIDALQNQNYGRTEDGLQYIKQNIDNLINEVRDWKEKA